MSKKIIVIGNGIAGISAIEEITKNSTDVNLTLISKENSASYYRPMLSEYISDSHNEKRFYLHDSNWYSENNIDVLLGREASSIEKDSKSIILDNGDKLNYDKLILANGSYNFIPPFNGHDKENIFSLRNLQDGDTIKSIAKNSKSATIIGGGILGLEVGWQLKKLGLDITVIEIMNRLLPVQLDEEASAIFEKKVLETGIKVIKSAKIDKILGEDKAEGVKLLDGTLIKSDFVIVSAGIRADISLGKTAELESNRGLLVNEKMETSESDIYAAGDVAEYNGINYAIWPEAMEQGKIAGLNSIGIESTYDPIIPSNIYMGMNMKLFSIGDVGNKEGIKYETIEEKSEDIFEKLYFVDDYFVGGILIGNISKSLKLKNALKTKSKKSDLINI